MVYNAALMKKLAFLAVLVLSTLYLVLSTQPVRAETQYEICPQPYGGAVVCGVHTPVETGIADNIPLVGSGLLGASGVLAYLSKKARKQI